MKRFHVHLAVKDLNDSIAFYSRLFGSDPAVTKADYAKWMLDDPRVNFAISTRGHAPGVNHLGLQVDSGQELESLRARAQSAELGAIDERSADCCYATSDKYWVRDPQGLAWETFHSLASIPMFGSDSPAAGPTSGPCCVPAAMPVRGACAARTPPRSSGDGGG